MAGALMLAACAGAPMDMSAGLNNGASVTRASEVRHSAIELRTLIETEGWVLNGGTPLMARLIRGSAPGETSLARYLDAAQDPVSEQMTEDARRVADLTRQTVRLALDAAGQRGAGPDYLAADLAAVEGALTAVRRSGRFFAAAAGEAGSDSETLMRALTDLDKAEHDLALAADALAERRWALRTGAVS